MKDGALHGDGSASRLFYREMKCLNCEFKADVRISRGGNSGIDVRARSGPGALQGYENRITAPDPPAPADAWVNHHVIIEGNHIQIFVNDKKIVDYTDEKNTYTEGYLALRQSGVGTVDFKNVMMRALPAPSTPFSGTWKLNSDQSKLAPDAPVETEIRVLDERDGIRWQSAAGNDWEPISMDARMVTTIGRDWLTRLRPRIASGSGQASGSPGAPGSQGTEENGSPHLPGGNEGGPGHGGSYRLHHCSRRKNHDRGRNLETRIGSGNSF